MGASNRFVPLILVYFLASSSLLVLNKVAITAIPNASLLLFIQLGSTVVIVTVPALVGTTRLNFKPDGKVVRAYTTVAAVFLATIYSNFQVIHSIGINAFIVLRCSTPLMVSVLDWAFMGRTLPKRNSLLALCGILVAGSVYAMLRVTNNGSSIFNGNSSVVSGMFWSMIWLSSFLFDMVYIKYVAEVYHCSALERTLYQNFLALPILVLFMTTGVEKYSLFEASTAPYSAYMAVILTCFAGAALSFTGMSLRTELSAASFTVVGIVCKMASTLLNEIFIEPEQDLVRLSCIGAVIISSAYYKQAPLKKVSR